MKTNANRGRFPDRSKYANSRLPDGSKHANGRVVARRCRPEERAAHQLHAQERLPIQTGMPFKSTWWTTVGHVASATRMAGGTDRQQGLLRAAYDGTDVAAVSHPQLERAVQKTLAALLARIEPAEQEVVPDPDAEARRGTAHAYRATAAIVLAFLKTRGNLLRRSLREDHHPMLPALSEPAPPLAAEVMTEVIRTSEALVPLNEVTRRRLAAALVEAMTSQGSVRDAVDALEPAALATLSSHLRGATASEASVDLPTALSWALASELIDRAQRDAIDPTRLQTMPRGFAGPTASAATAQEGLVAADWLLTQIYPRPAPKLDSAGRRL